jgi:hypothetical protein
VNWPDDECKSELPAVVRASASGGGRISMAARSATEPLGGRSEAHCVMELAHVEHLDLHWQCATAVPNRQCIDRPSGSRHLRSVPHRAWFRQISGRAAARSVWCDSDAVSLETGGCVTPHDRTLE